MTAARRQDLLPLLDLLAERCAKEGTEFEWEQAYSLLAEIVGDGRETPLWLVNVDETVAGYLILRLIQGINTQGAQAILDELYVRPQYRSPELSVRITDFAIQFCQAAGVRAFHQTLGRQWYLLTKWL